jgi:GNAT superfamily N-acetyltransferase
MSGSLHSVSMVRVSCEPFPSFALPAGYSLTWYCAGREDWWYDIQRRSDPLSEITRETFWRYFSGAPEEELPRRQCFLLDPNGQPIGTATAWFDNQHHGQVWGRLHWVAILPEFQGRGLAKPLLSVVCERMRQFHPGRSYLRTAAQRLPAIDLYLKFGFVPEIKAPEDAALWKSINDRLAQP